MTRSRPAPAKQHRRVPDAALLVLAVLLAGAVVFLTWPARAAIFCEQLPELTALAVCAATLLVFAFRALAHARSAQQPISSAASAAVLAGLAFFLSAHFVAQYRKPCATVQRQFHPAISVPR